MTDEAKLGSPRFALLEFPRDKLSHYHLQFNVALVSLGVFYNALQELMRFVELSRPVIFGRPRPK
jgi:hypothetical protein